MKSAARQLLGLILAPLVVPVISFISLVIAFPEDHDIGANIFTCVIVGIFSYVFCLGIGIPVHAIYKRKRRDSLQNYLVAGLLGGLASLLLVFSIFPGALKAPIDFMALSANFIISGCAAGMVFWLIAVKK